MPYYREGLTPRPDSQLPPPGQQRLEATVGDPLGYGRSSVVYALDNLKLPNSDPDLIVPSLVVKISRADRVAWMAREAWFYEELE